MNLNLIESLNANPQRVKMEFFNALWSVSEYFDSSISFYIIAFTRAFVKEHGFAVGFVITII